MSLALESERYRAERLEEQVNDLTELHQVIQGLSINQNLICVLFLCPVFFCAFPVRLNCSNAKRNYFIIYTWRIGDNKKVYLPRFDWMFIFIIHAFQNEIENLKQALADMEEKVQYQSDERLRDVNEVLENCQTRVS